MLSGNIVTLGNMITEATQWSTAAKAAGCTLTQLILVMPDGSKVVVSRDSDGTDWVVDTQ